MFDIGWQELFLIGIVALIVVGPKDLPTALRSAARFLNKARAMSREFQAGLAEMAREVELDELKRNVERTARFDLGEELRRTADPNGQLSADFDPTEFNRKLKESVESSPPAQYPRPSVPPASDAAAVTRGPTAPLFPLGDASPTITVSRPTSPSEGKDHAVDGSAAKE